MLLCGTLCKFFIIIAFTFYWNDYFLTLLAALAFLAPLQESPAQLRIQLQEIDALGLPADQPIVDVGDDRPGRGVDDARDAASERRPA